MAKPIYMSDEDIELALRKAVEQAAIRLKQKKCLDKFSINIDLTKSKKDNRICNIYFTPLAWAKVCSLVATYTTEVQWHGLVRRVSESEFEIYDILVPPHAVTSVTVISDDVEYCKWLNELDDAVFYDLHAHGHSHVNMAVTPSSTDEKYREDLVTQMPKPKDDEDAFYIFFIINKSHAISAEVFDLKHNAHYSDAEIDVDVLFADGSAMGDFLTNAKKVAKVATTSYGGNWQGSCGYGGYHGSKATPAVSSGKVTAPVGQSKKKNEDSKKEDDPFHGYGSMEAYLEALGLADYEGAGYNPDDVSGFYD